MHRSTFLSRLVIALATLTLAGLTQAQATSPPPLLDEVPFITSPDNVTLEMLQAARVGPSDHLIDLGSGDGRLVIVAAKRFGATGLGVDIVPDLVDKSLHTAREVGVADKVTFKVQDLFETCLLYTSPSPRDRQKSRMPSSA